MNRTMLQILILTGIGLAGQLLAEDDQGRPTGASQELWRTVALCPLSTVDWLQVIPAFLVGGAAALTGYVALMNELAKRRRLMVRLTMGRLLETPESPSTRLHEINMGMRRTAFVEELDKADEGPGGGLFLVVASNPGPPMRLQAVGVQLPDGHVVAWVGQGISPALGSELPHDGVQLACVPIPYVSEESAKRGCKGRQALKGCCVDVHGRVFTSKPISVDLGRWAGIWHS